MRRCAGFASLFLLGVVACDPAREIPEAGPVGPPDVLLITVDTFRADHAGCMGHPRGLTPGLDRAVRTGLLASNAFAPTPLTAPSHASILTGLDPPRHGVRDNGAFPLPDSLPTMATILREQGFRTGAFIAAFPLDSRFGFANGFEKFDEELEMSDQSSEMGYVYYAERPAIDVTDAALHWLETVSRTDRAFVWAHYFDPHYPRRVPRVLRRLPDADDYGREIVSMDREIHRLVREVEATRGRRAIVAIASDHGEALGDHGESSHGILLYSESVHALFGVNVGPHGPTGIHKPVTRHADLLPTLLEALDIEAPRTPDGRSILSERVAGAGVYGETYYPTFHYRWSPLLSWRTEEWFYLEGPDPELYDRVHDPAERHDVIDEHPAVAEQLARRIADVAAEPPDPEAENMDEETREKLAALGYVSIGSSLGADRTKNPVKLIGVTNLLYRGITLFSEGNASAALVHLQRAYRADPENASVMFYLANCFRELGDPTTSMAYYRRVLEIMPDASEASAHLAVLEFEQGRHDVAMELVEDGLRANAEAFALLMTKGDLTRGLGEHELAETAYRRAAEASPRRVEPWVRLAELARDRGDDAGARKHWERAFEIDPDSPLIPGALRESLGR